MAYEMVHARIVGAHAVLSKIARDHPAFEANSQMQSVALQEIIRTGPVLGLPSSFHFLKICGCFKTKGGGHFLWLFQN